MKNQRKSLIPALSIFIIAILLYLSDAATATAGERPESDIIGRLAAKSEKPVEPKGDLTDFMTEPVKAAEPLEGAELFTDSEQAAEFTEKQKQPEGDAAVPEPPAESVEGAEPSEGDAAVPEEPAESVEGAEPSEGDAAVPEEPAESVEEAEPSEGDTAVPEEPAESEDALEQSESSVTDKAHVVEAGQFTDPDTAATAEEFQVWMETHANTGGFLKLTDNITLSGSHVFLPDGPGCPHVNVDTDGHTITITGEVEFWNDYHLTFRGGTENAVIFRVAEGGILNLNHISVECAAGEPSSEEDLPYVLWQEEGAGLMVDSCRISGKIHYADAPFVLYESTVSVIVEKGQQAALPAEIACDVNFQGQVSHRELLPVSWNLAGKESYQAERMRFQVSGSYVGAASVTPPLCTVIYNDYPLTFTEVQASAGQNTYLFRYGYTKSAELFPATIVSEYSLDGKNWFFYEEENVSGIKEIFFIGLTNTQWNTAEYPYLYLRLHCEYEGVQYFSNVLRFAADNLKDAVDQGGGRGGGVSVINPPKEPEEKPGHVPSEGTVLPTVKPENGGSHASSDSESGEYDSSSDSGNGEYDSSSDSESDENSSPSGAKRVGNDLSSKPESSGNDLLSGAKSVGNDLSTKPESIGNGSLSGSESVGNDSASKPENSGNDSASKSESMDNDSSLSSEESSNEINTGLSASDNDALQEQPSSSLNPESHAVEKAVVSPFGRTLAIAAGFVGLSVAAGAAGFCANAGIFRRLLQLAVKWFR